MAFSIEPIPRSTWHGRLAHASFFLSLILILIPAGCDSDKQTPKCQVVLYTSVDEPVARPIIAEFEKSSGIKVILKTDTEAMKTAGLAAALEAERDRPRADVWWGNEVFHTVALADAGVLAEYDSAAAAKIPAQFKDGARRWAGTSLRVRVVAVHTGGKTRPKVSSILDLADPEYRGKIAIARPAAGTTRGHFAALYTLWGRENTKLYLTNLRANGVTLVGGNSVVAEQVANGNMVMGLTDNDDVDSAMREGGKLDMVIPDQGPNQTGALVIPCTVGLVKGGPNGEPGKKLVDYLLSADVEKKLLDAKFARYSVFDEKNRPARIMPVDYTKAAANMKAATDLALEILEGRR